MSSKVELDVFVRFITKNKNKKQNVAILKEISVVQYKFLKTLANKILNKVISVSSSQYKALLPHKSFIRKLGRDKVSRKVLATNLKTVQLLLTIFLNGNEKCKKTGVSSNRRMGRNTERKSKIEKKYNDNRSKSDSSDQSSEIWDQCYNKEEETDEEIDQVGEEKEEYSESDQSFSEENRE